MQCGHDAESTCSAGPRVIALDRDGARACVDRCASAAVIDETCTKRDVFIVLPRHVNITATSRDRGLKHGDAGIPVDKKRVRHSAAAHCPAIPDRQAVPGVGATASADPDMPTGGRHRTAQLEHGAAIGGLPIAIRP